METLADKTILLAICLIAFLVVPADAMNIGLLLGSFTFSIALGLLPERAGLAVLIVALAAACVFQPATMFIAPVTYCCMRTRYAWGRFAWIVVPLLAFWRLGFDAWALSVALDLVACVLATRTNMLLSERRQYRVLRDGLREKSISLETRNKALADKMDALAIRQGGTDTMASNPAPVQNEARLTLVLANLTERELEIAAYVARGLDNKEIAAEVFASEGTVRNHISAILQKSGLHNRTQLAVAYLNAREL